MLFAFQPDAVYDDFNCMLFLLVELDAVLKVCHDTVYTGTHEPSFFCVVDYLLVFALLAPDNGRENLYFRVYRPRHNRIYNLINRLL